MKAGVDVFMSKPFDVDKLRSRLEQLLQTRREIEKKLCVETTVHSQIKRERNGYRGGFYNRACFHNGREYGKH